MNFVLEYIDSAFGLLVEYLAKVLFYDILGFPLIVIVLVIGALTFTFYFRFINIRALKHSVDIIRGKYDNPKDEGQISHFQALTSALSATIGLGNIAGVAIAVAQGGAGAVFWMMVIAVFSMSAKFVSASLAQLYRQIDSNGSVSGGPMYYISMGLGAKGGAIGKLGKFLGALYALFIIGGAFGGGNMFQANQSYELVATQVPLLADNSWLYGLILSALVGLVILGGIVRIGKATEKIVPSMVLLYCGASLFIIFTNIDKLPGVINSIFTQAFNPQAFYGGVLGVLVIGIRRAIFSNEGGVGSAAIAHSAAKTDEPIREGIVAMIGPFVDTIVICFMTASVLLITMDNNHLLQNYNKAKINVYETEQLLSNAKTEAEIKSITEDLGIANDELLASNRGAEFTSVAFSTVFSWFSVILSIIVFLFSYSTMISWYYYGDKGWIYLFGKRSKPLYQGLFLFCVFFGSITKLGNVLEFSDMMILSAAFPNIIGAMFLLPEVKNRLNDYWDRYKQGTFKTYK
ncbi:MAG: alanine:cation symporter family protein [Candidatus Marinimicrobia bacterium]|nr:alanine:cation symporter family protein [Candidatus Neomarinimicrobiota bacterium]MBL7023171.1 alanine:cation symporter family protein [Candidatus Neomarinimicrobiota bacterium]MBL7109021.1 alanine:cation symporter family protein [Candidatus Neomarinimicrobiota bacterium]